MFRGFYIVLGSAHPPRRMTSSAPIVGRQWSCTQTNMDLMQAPSWRCRTHMQFSATLASVSPMSQASG